MLGLFGVVSVTCAQSIPGAAKTAFAKLHPQATAVKWDKEDGGYEASFKEKGKTMSVVMDGQGMLKETETDIAVSELCATMWRSRCRAKKSVKQPSLSMRQGQKSMKPKWAVKT